MAKKKKSHHKKVHRAKASRGQRPQVAAAPVMPAAPAADPAPKAAVSSRPVIPAAPANPRLAYLAGDLRRIGILVGVCVVIELGLWFLVRHTGFGSQLFRAINI